MRFATARLPPLPTIRELIRLYNLRASKHLSQNFLLDMNICKKIVKKAGNIKNGWVCEVGPGPGGITRAILERTPEKLVVIEKDARFLPGLELLNDAYGGNIQIFHGDVLNFDMENIFPASLGHAWSDNCPNIHIMGNLPFSVSTPLIIMWLQEISEKKGAWKYGRVKLTLTFQKEVAERMTAGLRNNQRSRLSIMCQYLCDVNHMFTIPGEAFVPKPDVDVAVVQFTPLVQPKIELPFKLVEKVVRHAFHFRRKMCKRGIQTLFPPDRPDLTQEMFTKADVNPVDRPFLLTMEEFRRLCQAYHDICSSNPGMYDYDYRSLENASVWRHAVEPLNI